MYPSVSEICLVCVHIAIALENFSEQHFNASGRLTVSMAIIGWALDRVHNLRRSLDRLFALCDTVILTFELLTYNINWWARYRDWLSCTMFGDFSFSRFGFYRAGRQTDRITDADDCYTHATTAGVSNYPSVSDLKPGFHYPSWRPELTARVDG